MAELRRNERDTSISTYRARRDFAVTPEPAPQEERRQARPAGGPIFVVQKHDARRLHWDFRLEHDGVLWSWAVPKGPSLDPADKRLAVRTEDHPLDYADFAGTIPEGQYGAGTVETWDRGSWQPVGDPEAGLAKGELKFKLSGSRLNGGFVLVRLKPKGRDRAENWLLIKEHDEAEERGGDAPALESERPPPKPPRRRPKTLEDVVPAPRAVRGALPADQKPELATLVDNPPAGEGWVSEIKFDGYRLLAFKDGEKVRLVTRNGNDWTSRLPTIARAVAQLEPPTLLLDGELVALQETGASNFARLQEAMAEKSDRQLFFYLFDLLHRNGWDLRPCRLIDRKRALARLSPWKGALRYSDHHEGESAAMQRQACAMGLEGIICKRADAPYRPGRGRDWLKVKCQNREEFIVIGWTPPAGSRQGLGSLHLGYRDEQGQLQYVGGVGTGFSERELTSLRERLDKLAADPPTGLVYAGEPPERAIHWVKLELVAEVRFAGWSGSGRIRHATYLGLREDKKATEVVRRAADPDAERIILGQRRPTVVRASRPKPAAAQERPRTIRPRATTDTIDHVRLTHADRELWPGITKRDLAEYWRAVAKWALPEIAGRPLALVRCPEGIDGERFFQKHARPGFPEQIRAGKVGTAPYLVVDDLSGLLACAQVAAIELHAWGSKLPDAEHPDQLVFDLDPGESVAFADVVAAAHEVRDRLNRAGLVSFCRTTGGKGLHVVAPLRPRADWDSAKAWARAFAESMARDAPDRFVSRMPKAERRGHILVDWLRNGLGATAVASFSPRARPGATVATRLSWREVTPALDPAAFTLSTVPARLAKQRSNPWAGFDAADQVLPHVSAKQAVVKRRR